MCEGRDLLPAPAPALGEFRLGEEGPEWLRLRLIGSAVSPLTHSRSKALGICRWPGPPLPDTARARELVAGADRAGDLQLGSHSGRPGLVTRPDVAMVAGAAVPPWLDPAMAAEAEGPACCPGGCWGSWAEGPACCPGGCRGSWAALGAPCT